MSQTFTTLLNRLLPELLGNAIGGIALPEVDVGSLMGLNQTVVWGMVNGQLSRDEDGKFFAVKGALQ
jgi:hypothetical protein